jgi:hypothetical protein
MAKAEYEKKKAAYEATLKPTAEAVISVCPFSSFSMLAFHSDVDPVQPETAASVPVHQDTSEDDEHSPLVPVPATASATTAARIKSPLAGRPSHATRSAQVAQEEAGLTEDEDVDVDVDVDDDEGEEEELVPPPKKRARKSAPPPPPVVTKEKEKAKERKERKEKKRV